MKTWKVILVSTLVTLAIGGVYLFSVWKHRQNPGVIGQQSGAGEMQSLDDVAVVRILSPAHFDDLSGLPGTSVWMKDGYAMPYYPFSGGRVVFAKRVGLIPAAQRMDVKKIVKQAVPAQLSDSMEHGSRQAFAVFSLPGGTDLLATPVGYMQGDDEAYYTDLLFYYDDPHKIYDNWPKDVWAAIDAHQVKLGMSELETRMSIGQNEHPDSQAEGDRTVTYDQDGKKWIVNYVKNRATSIKTP
jgi:hypothetical protein